MRPKVTHGGRQHEPDGKVVRSRLRSVAAQVRLLEGEIYYQNDCDVPSMKGEFWSRELASLVSSSFTIEKLEPITDSGCIAPSVLKDRGYTQFARSSFWQTSNAGLPQFPGSLKHTHTVAAGVGSIALQLGFAAISGDRLWFLLQPSSVDAGYLYKSSEGAVWLNGTVVYTLKKVNTNTLKPSSLKSWWLCDQPKV